jgi:hypothetical protein
LNCGSTSAATKQHRIHHHNAATDPPKPERVLRESAMDGPRRWKRGRSRKRTRRQEVHHKMAGFTEAAHDTGDKQSKAAE